MKCVFLHFSAHCGNPSIRTRKRKWTHLVRRTAQGIPSLPGTPYPFAGFLSLTAQLIKIDARDAAALASSDPINDDGIDIVADTAINNTLDWIANRTVAQTIPPREIHDYNIRSCTWC